MCSRLRHAEPIAGGRGRGGGARQKDEEDEEREEEEEEDEERRLMRVVLHPSLSGCRASQSAHKTQPKINRKTRAE